MAALPGKVSVDCFSSTDMLNKHMEHLLRARPVLGAEGPEVRSCCPCPQRGPRLLLCQERWTRPRSLRSWGVGRFLPGEQKEDVSGRGQGMGKGVAVWEGGNNV